MSPLARLPRPCPAIREGRRLSLFTLYCLDTSTGFGPPVTSAAMCLWKSEQDGSFIVAGIVAGCCLRPLAAPVRFATLAVGRRGNSLFIDDIRHIQLRRIMRHVGTHPGGRRAFGRGSSGGAPSPFSSAVFGQNSTPIPTSMAASGRLRPTTRTTLMSDAGPTGLLNNAPRGASGICAAAAAATSVPTSAVSVFPACPSATTSSCSLALTIKAARKPRTTKLPATMK